MSTDIFGKESLDLKKPITADKCFIMFDGDIVATAMQFSLEYSQQVTRRRSIGNKNAVIYGSQPQGRATIARLLTTSGNVTKGDSWTGCGVGTMAFHLGGCDEDGATYAASGCIVTSYSIQAQAEDLTVVDNVTIEFMELAVQD